MYNSSVTRRLILFSCMYFLGMTLAAQRQFRLLVSLPPAIRPEKMKVWLNNGKEAYQIKPQTITGQQMFLTGEYYSLYAAINLQYPNEGADRGFVKEFFIGEKPASILFSDSGLKDEPFSKYTLQNVEAFDQEKQQLNTYTATEQKLALDFERQYGESLFSGHDTAIRNRYFKVIMPELGRKALAYIVSHLNSYYSFYVFRTTAAKPNIVSWDSLQHVFQSFPDPFKYSDEGNYINAFLHSRLLVSGSGGDAVNFASKDIHNNRVSLAQFKGSKYVLLHFWATWCTPCIKELPALKQIQDQYAAKGLQVISIALKSNEADFKKAIKKYGLDWIHIYNDIDLLNKYGNQPTPRICLVDKAGKLIYDVIGLGNSGDYELKELASKLKQTLHE